MRSLLEVLETVRDNRWGFTYGLCDWLEVLSCYGDNPAEGITEDERLLVMSELEKDFPGAHNGYLWPEEEISYRLEWIDGKINELKLKEQEQEDETQRKRK